MTESMVSVSSVSLDFRALEKELMGMARAEVMASDIRDRKLRRGSLLLMGVDVKMYVLNRRWKLQQEKQKMEKLVHSPSKGECD